MKSVNQIQEPLISIIIPCFNCSTTLTKTLESLEKQSYLNFEILLVNDGSLDSTENIIKLYTETSNLNINYFYKKNEGVSIARNLGIEKSKGKYLLFLDSDDVYHFDFIRSLLTTVEQKNVDTAYCYWSKDINLVFNSTIAANEREINIMSQKDLMVEFLYNKGKIGFWSFIYKADIIHKHSIKFTPYRKNFEDVEFTWKYLVHCNFGAIVDKQMYGYRDTPNSAVKQIYWERTDSLKSVKNIEEYLKKHNCAFYLEFENYMYSRMIWSYAKTFAIGNRMDLYKRLIFEFDVKFHMGKLVKKDSNKLVRISSLFYCINPMTFYKLIRIYEKLNKYKK